MRREAIAILRRGHDCPRRMVVITDEAVPKIGKHVKVKRDEGVIAGVRKHFRGDEEITLEQETYTFDEIVAIFEEHLAMLGAIDFHARERSIAIAEEAKLEPKVRALALALKTHMSSRMGKESPRLREFAFKPAKKPHVPVETKLRAIEKRAETRKLRHTMGKKQRRRIKG